MKFTSCLPILTNCASDPPLLQWQLTLTESERGRKKIDRQQNRQIDLAVDLIGKQNPKLKYVTHKQFCVGVPIKKPEIHLNLNLNNDKEKKEKKEKKLLMASLSPQLLKGRFRKILPMASLSPTER